MGNKASRKKRVSENELSKDEKLQLITTLNEIPILHGYTDKDLAAVAEEFEKRTYQKGDYVMKKGDQGTEFYMIHSGSAAVLALKGGEEVRIAELDPGDYFGEQALLNKTKRNASIQALGDLSVFVLGQEAFKGMTKKLDVQFIRRKGLAKEGHIRRESLTPAHAKTKEERDFIVTAIKGNMLFQHNKKIVEEVIGHFHPVKVEKGVAICTEGDTDAQFYVIREGEFEVHKTEKGVVATLGKGQAFGEQALFYDAPRNATVTAKTGGSMWVLGRLAFRSVIVTLRQDDHDSIFNFLRKMDLFKPLLNREIQKIALCLKPVEYKAGTIIFNQGDEKGTKFYIVEDGSVLGVKEVKEEKEKFELKHHQYFGEVALLEDAPRNATIKAGWKGCTLLELERQDFDDLLGPLKNIMGKEAAERTKPAHARKTILSQISELEDLKTLGLLGRGAFGKVTLVMDPKTEKTFALKAIKKKQIEELAQQEHIVQEKQIMQMMDSNFLVRLYRTYKDDHRVYFLLEACLGGELFLIYRTERKFKESVTRFYAASVIEAFDYMHSMNIVYRDLKPENIVLDNNGYAKVADFGFAKVTPKLTYTFCGTPDYLAPEVINIGQGHGLSVDWWCVGILIYELIAGVSPFYCDGADGEMKMFRKIKSVKYKCPSFFTKEAQDIVGRLLRKDPAKRLPMRKGGADNMRNHPWFRKFNWEALRNGEMKAPIRPKVKHHKDFSNFRQRDHRPTVMKKGARVLHTPWDVVF